MRRNDGRGFESHATAEKYNGHLISAQTPSTATTGEIPVNQAGDLGMLLQTEDHYTKCSNKKRKRIPARYIELERGKSRNLMASQFRPFGLGSFCLDADLRAAAQPDGN
jgi:hypothetical protein